LSNGGWQDRGNHLKERQGDDERKKSFTPADHPELGWRPAKTPNGWKGRGDRDNSAGNVATLVELMEKEIR